MVAIQNQSNVINARYGYYKGGKYLFTHRDPATGSLWGEDIPIGKSPIEFGAWVPSDSVRLIWDDGDGKAIVEPPKKRGKKNKKVEKSS